MSYKAKLRQLRKKFLIDLAGKAEKLDNKMIQYS